MSHHTPKQPAQEDISIFNTWNIDMAKGRIYNSQGKEIGNIRDGYTVVGTYRDKPRFFKRYHIVWWKAKGFWPRMEIDHEDRVKTHDWINNLYEKTRRGNMSNIDKVSTLPTGVCICASKINPIWLKL